MNLRLAGSAALKHRCAFFLEGTAGLAVVVAFEARPLALGTPADIAAGRLAECRVDRKLGGSDRQRSVRGDAARYILYGRRQRVGGNELVDEPEPQRVLCGK